jgi:hypothetical protein
LFVFLFFFFGYCIVFRSFGHCIVCPFSIGHCIVCPFSFGHCIVHLTYSFWLPLWHFQIFLKLCIWKSAASVTHKVLPYVPPSSSTTMEKVKSAASVTHKVLPYVQ